MTDKDEDFDQVVKIEIFCQIERIILRIRPQYHTPLYRHLCP